MRTGRGVLVPWGVCVALIAILGATVFGLDALPTGLLAGAGMVIALVGLVAGGRATSGRRAREDAAPELLPDLSFATIGVAVGATLTLVGLAAVGPFLFWPAVGLVVFSLAGVAREKRAERSALAAVTAGEPRGA